ncbi:MAG: Glu/Leu/Phe/Val family dehydrogenase, partial [Deinococcales bacterium]
AGIQGFGTVGRYAALGLFERGVRVVAVSDSSGAIYAHDGIDIPELIIYKEKTGSVVGFTGAKRIDQESLLTLPVDILVPAVREGAIHAGNAAKIEANIIAEGANHAITKAADAILEREGRFIIPDYLANSGGVIVSYYEWVQDFNNFYWSEEEIKQNLEQHFTHALDNVYAVRHEKNLNLRQAAFVLALGRILESNNLRGLYP